MLIRRLGFRCEEASDGLEAYEKSLTFRPDVIIMDLMMPGTDGLTGVRMLRADPTTSKIPVIVLTSIDTMGACQKCLQAGASAFVNKPLTKEALSGVLANFVNTD